MTHLALLGLLWLESAATPPQLWARVQRGLPPFTYSVTRDEVVPSDTDPRLRLRRLEVRFTSQAVGRCRRPMDHTGVVFMPADPTVNSSPERRGKVVVVGQRLGDATTIDNYGEPIAARSGYPTMVLPVPGEYDGHDGESCWMYFLQSELAQTQDPVEHQFFRLAVPYVRALDVLSGILGVEKVRAIVGGHSKRATSAYMAAAMDPERIVGLVLMGQEGNWRVPPVDARILYVGASNEAGYQMFNIAGIQARMGDSWTISYIPNYRHAANSEVQAMAWPMWVAHVFDGRPITRIASLAHEENAEGTTFRARLDSPNKIIHVKAWYVYNDGDPYWRDLMWYPVELVRRGEQYEGFLEGELPDAWLLEVKDTSAGVRGYVSSVPQDLTHRPVKWRSGSMFPRAWRPKTAPPSDPPAAAPVSARDAWTRAQRILPPFTYRVLRDGTVSAGDRGARLRRVEVQFRSQSVGRFRRAMDHTGVLYLPAAATSKRGAERAARVVVVAGRLRDTVRNHDFGKSMAARTQYPTMVLPIPGEYEGHEGDSCWAYFLESHLKETKDPADHSDFRLAIPYLRALDVAADLLGRPDIRAVIGGDGSRAAAAYMAAAMDPQRVAGVVYAEGETAKTGSLDCEGPTTTGPALTPGPVPARVAYIRRAGALGERPGDPGQVAPPPAAWTILSPSEPGDGAGGGAQAIAWGAWVAHVFDGRPLTRITRPPPE